MPNLSLSEADLRTVRAAYDRLAPGDRAVLRRCRRAGDLQLEGAFWRVVSAAPKSFRPRLAHVVVAFPGAPQLKRPGSFRSGRFLRRLLHGTRTPNAGEAVAFRRMIAAEDMDDFTHQLRRALTRTETALDWGVLGLDIVYWSDSVRRRWVQDFYSPLKEEGSNA